MSRQLDRHPKDALKSDIATFASLNNLQVLMPHQDPEYLIIDKHLATRLLEGVVSTIYVDESWYLEQYADIRTPIEQGILTSPKDHYVHFGFFEHRMPYHICVMEEWYLSQYPDVRAAVHRDDFASGQAHFESVGFREGRLPFANFVLRRI